MHIAVVLFVALIVLGAKASAQDLTIAPRLREGDEFRLELRRVRTQRLRDG